MKHFVNIFRWFPNIFSVLTSEGLAADPVPDLESTILFVSSESVSVSTVSLAPCSHAVSLESSSVSSCGPRL